MKRCVYDIEGNGLLVRCTEVHCIVVFDLDTRETFRYRPGEIEDGIAKLQEYDRNIGHNVIGYDAPVLEKLYPHCGPLPKQVDTLLMSRMLWGTGQAPGGGHGLESWGCYFKFEKIEFNEFGSFSEEMLEYCVRDVHLNVKVYEYLAPEFTKDLWYGYNLECDTRRILSKQELNGFYLDPERYRDLLQYLEVSLAELQDRVDSIISPVDYTVQRRLYWIVRKPGDLYSEPVYKTFKTKKAATDAGFKDKNIEPGPLVTKKIRFNANSGDQIVEFFKDKYNWNPTVLTEKGNPSVSGDVLEDLEFEEAPLFLDYQTVCKRISQVESWPKFMIENRVHGSVNTVGTDTYRMSHSDPNVAQVTGKEKKYGKECRACWVPTPGMVLVGTDAAGLELRMFANALYPFDGGKYIPVVCYQDPHEHNRQLAGLEERHTAKTAIYAFTYGCGLIKMGKSTAGSKNVDKEASKEKIPKGYLSYMKENDLYTKENAACAKRGIVVKRRFMENISGFQDLLDSLSEEWNANNKEYIRGVDGRRIPVKSEHTLLNRRLQSDGAVVMKEAIRIHHNKCEEEFGPHGGIWAYCANIHDEFQVECDPSIKGRMKAIGKWCIAKAGSNLGLVCPLSGDSKVGDTWYDTH